MPNLTPFESNWPDAGRHEPETFGASVPDDPYKAWLARREAEQERQQDAAVRWVVRPRTVATAAAQASATAIQGAGHETGSDGQSASARLTPA
jgi:hypothetical protein